MEPSPSRRKVIKNLLMTSAGIGALGSIAFDTSAKEKGRMPNGLKGNINHSVCYWIYRDYPLDQFCGILKDLGLSAIDLLGPKEWPIIQQHGISCAMCNGAEIGLYEGFNHTDYHSTLIKSYTEWIPLVAKAGYTNLICFSGARKGMDDETGLRNCVQGLQQLLPLAEKNGVTLVMELLNSKIDHKDYMCDHTAWGVELCKRIGSGNFKLLYDIYHMQIDEGDIIRNITENHEYIAHYHTGGVPGRHEIDDTQELYYPAVMKAIVATGFKGHVAQEFTPSQPDKIASLKKCINICDV
jgi:hydroxypyruvate isomerase